MPPHMAVALLYRHVIPTAAPQRFYPDAWAIIQKPEYTGCRTDAGKTKPKQSHSTKNQLYGTTISFIIKSRPLMISASLFPQRGQ